MATGGIVAVPLKRDIFQLARTCEGLFLEYTDPQLKATENRARAELQLQRFYVWASYLGVFAGYDASLDKRLQYSDGIQSLVLQLLSLVQVNLEFLNGLQDELAQSEVEAEEEVPKTERTSKIQGTATEALDTVEATINRLNSLGSTIRRYSASSLESRVKAFTEKHGDENYTELAKQIVYFKYRAATPSLQMQLALSMAARRQRLKYIRRHQEKLAAGLPQKPENVSKDSLTTKKSRLPALQQIDETAPENAPTSWPPAGKETEFRLSNNNRVAGMLAPPSVNTKASSFRQTPSLVAKLQRADGVSVVSSSKQSTTLMAEDLEDYPEPPKRETGKPDPICPYCCQPLQESDLKIRKWRRHVDQDLRPYICISEKCSQQPEAFNDFSIWANHMRQLHSTKWTQLVHKPIVWRCDVDHPVNVVVFTNEEGFEAHLDSEHGDYSQTARRAISRSCRVSRRRAPNICPLCGFDVSAPDPSQVPPASADKLKLDDVENLTKLTKHIAGHLRRLAFDSTNNLEASGGADEDSSHESMKRSNWAKPDGPNMGPPSGLKDLSSVSLNFTDTVNLLQVLNEMTVQFDIDWEYSEFMLLVSTLEESPSAEAVDWDAVKATLKREMNPELLADLEHNQGQDSPDRIIQDMHRKKLFVDTISLRSIWDDAGAIPPELDSFRLRAYLATNPDILDAMDPESGLTPLAKAILSGNATTARLLLDNGASPDKKTADGRTPVYLAAQGRWQRARMIQILLDKNPATFDEPCQELLFWTEYTPLMVAVKRGDPDAVRLLVNRGASKDKRNPMNITARDFVDDSNSNSHSIRRALQNLPSIDVPLWPLPGALLGEDISEPTTIKEFKKNLDNMIARGGLEGIFPPDDPYVLQVAKKAAELRNDPDNVLNSPAQIDCLAKLALYQPVFYCDDSGSMWNEYSGPGTQKGDKWQAQIGLVSNMADIVTRAVPNNSGCHLRFINKDFPHGNNLDVDSIRKALREGRQITRWRPIGTMLRKHVLDEIVYNELDSGRLIKRPFLIICLTYDFLPTQERAMEGTKPGPEDLNENEDANRFLKEIKNCTRLFESKGYKRDGVRFSISRIGNIRDSEDNYEAKEHWYRLEAVDEIQDVLYMNDEILGDKYQSMPNRTALETWLLTTLLLPIRSVLGDHLC